MKLNSRGQIIQESPDTLTHGQWVRRGLVWDWVPAVAEVEREPPTPKPRRATVELIACPVCNALIYECCRTRNGKPANGTHKGRLLPRACVCGGPLRRTQDRLCAHCRSEPDHVVVERVLAGEWRMRVNPPERIEVTARWLADGRPQADLERLTGWNLARILRDSRKDAA